jgi:hypothetical protein
VQISNRRFVRVGGLIFLTIALALSAQAVVFSNASLKGSYSFLVNKWTADVNSTQGAQVGVVTFDGTGNVTESYTAINGGVVQTGANSGTYTVKSNGTGTINWIDGHQTAIVLNSTANGLAHGVQVLATDDNFNEVIIGTALLQSTIVQTYGVASLKGNFTFQDNLWTANVNQTQLGTIGTISFDGKGNVKGSFTLMNGGVLQTGIFTGFYTVNSDGSGTSPLGNGAQLAFVLNNKPTLLATAKGLQFLATNTTGNNIVVSGIALKQ